MRDGKGDVIVTFINSIPSTPTNFLFEAFMQQEIDNKLIQAVVLLDRQFLLTDYLIESKKITLKEFEQALAEKRQSISQVLSVYNYIFALIDNLVRYQKIASVIPRLSQKKKNFKILKRR